GPHLPRPGVGARDGRDDARVLRFEPEARQARDAGYPAGVDHDRGGRYERGPYGVALRARPPQGADEGRRVTMRRTLIPGDTGTGGKRALPCALLAVLPS